MSELVVRRLTVDFSQPFPRHWCGGDPFRTALFNALSMSFPVGEQFFIDSIRAGVKALPPEAQARFETEVAGFVGQEATHRHIHGQYNAQLEAQGLRNTWGPRAKGRIPRLAKLPALQSVAATAAYEHFTAMLAEYLLSHPEQIASSDPRLTRIWLWHAAEESEHKTTAFDLFQALGGDQACKVRWIKLVTFFLLTDLARQTLRNLWTDGQLFRPRTWRNAARFLFGRDGVVAFSKPAWRDYFRPDFHPSQQSTPLSADWLRANSEHFRVVGRAA